MSMNLIRSAVTACAAVSVATLCACASPSRADVEAELLAATAAYNAAWDDLDLARIESLHAERFSYLRRGVVYAGSRDAFARTYHDDVATQIIAYDADELELDAHAFGPDAGLVSFLIRGTVTTPDGVVHPYDGALTYAFERGVDGAWRVVHIHESMLSDAH